MIKKSFYENQYKKELETKIKRYRNSIFGIIIVVILYAVFSVIIIDQKSYEWLLYLNIVIEIIAMILIFLLWQLYIPTCKWEMRLATSARGSSFKIITAKILEIKKNDVWYDGQRMISITIQVDSQEREVFIRPWNFDSYIQKGKVYNFKVSSRCIVAYERRGDQ